MLGSPRAIVFASSWLAMVGPGMWNIIVILGAVYWTRYARVIRGEVLTLREREFVKLAEIAGAGKWRVIKRHILPNVMNTATVLASLTVGVVIIAEASLSFLGVGVPPPQPAWGLMLSEARATLMAGQWWLTVFPGVCILLIVLRQLFGDWLRVPRSPDEERRTHSRRMTLLRSLRPPDPLFTFGDTSSSRGWVSFALQEGRRWARRRVGEQDDDVPLDRRVAAGRPHWGASFSGDG
jgi:peptide/nickel transport system permease protein